jgi:hypothetical protein
MAMPVWAWVLIVIVVVALVVLVAWQLVNQQRTRRLREQLGPAYERTVTAAESWRDAEAELAAREERRQQFELRPLSLEERTRYSEEWQAVQAQFVDDRAAAVVRADGLIQSVMADCGYPIDEFEQRAADLSVDHPRVVKNYRTGHRLFEKSAAGQGSTEDLRHAMRAYRAMFNELVEDDDADSSADQPPTRAQREETPALSQTKAVRQ